MVKGTTKSGFNFTIDERIFGDYRFTDVIAESKIADTPEDKMVAFKKVADMMLGNNKQGLIDHICSRNEGFCPNSEFERELSEIMLSTKELKNSSSSPSA